VKVAMKFVALASIAAALPVAPTLPTWSWFSGREGRRGLESSRPTQETFQYASENPVGTPVAWHYTTEWARDHAIAGPLSYFQVPKMCAASPKIKGEPDGHNYRIQEYITLDWRQQYGTVHTEGGHHSWTTPIMDKKLHDSVSRPVLRPSTVRTTGDVRVYSRQNPKYNSYGNAAQTDKGIDQEKNPYDSYRIGDLPDQHASDGPSTYYGLTLGTKHVFDGKEYVYQCQQGVNFMRGKNRVTDSDTQAAGCINCWVEEPNKPAEQTMNPSADYVPYHTTSDYMAMWHESEWYGGFIFNCDLPEDQWDRGFAHLCAHCDCTDSTDWHYSFSDGEGTSTDIEDNFSELKVSDINMEDEYFYFEHDINHEQARLAVMGKILMDQKELRGTVEGFPVVYGPVHFMFEKISGMEHILP